MKKTKIAIILLCVLIALPLFAGEGDYGVIKSSLYSLSNRETLIGQLNLGSTVNPALPVQSASLAVADSSYMVTPGDIYSLVYYDLSPSGTSGSTITVSIQADADCCVYVPVIGRVNAKGLTYTQLRDLICSHLTESKAYSNPHMTFVSCGVFQVNVCGEVVVSKLVETWGLARLSDFCGLATEYASSRDVTVIYPDGHEVSYDLYKALSDNQVDQNPCIQPGCTIRFNRADKLVSVDGCVCKAGQYQVLDGETIADLINDYANGFDLKALNSQVVVKGYRDGSFVTELVTENEFDSYVLHDMDSVYVSSLNAAGSYVTVQGAIEGSRFFYEIYNGETANQLVREIQSLFLQNSDLENIYVLRDGKKILIEYNEALSSNKLGSIVLKEGDVLVVPYNQQYVTVSGGVAKPGNYEYEPDRPASYYINLAGGYTTDAKEDSLTISDVNGNRLELTNPVPENGIVLVKKRNTNIAAKITLGISLATLGLELFKYFTN